MLVPFSAFGITSSRNVLTRSVVAFSDGPCLEIALKNARRAGLVDLDRGHRRDPRWSVTRPSGASFRRESRWFACAGDAQLDRDDQRTVDARPEVLRRSGRRPDAPWSTSTARPCPAGRASARGAGSSAGSGSPARPAARGPAAWRSREPTSPTGPFLACSSVWWRCRTRSELIRGPSIASPPAAASAPRSTATTTAIAAIRPIVVTSGMPATASETSAIVTVQPAKNTAPPDVAAARAIDSSHVEAFVSTRGNAG